jgi:hypothetical protein
MFHRLLHSANESFLGKSTPVPLRKVAGLENNVMPTEKKQTGPQTFVQIAQSLMKRFNPVFLKRIFVRSSARHSRRVST